MSSIKLDLSKFKHEKSDKNFTTLRHKDGHTITMAHKGLSKDARAQLSELSKIAQEAETSSEHDQLKHKGLMADGGDVKPETDQFGYPKSKNPRQDTPEQTDKYKGMKKGFEEGTKAQGAWFAEGGPTFWDKMDPETRQRVESKIKASGTETIDDEEARKRRVNERLKDSGRLPNGAPVQMQKQGDGYAQGGSVCDCGDSSCKHHEKRQMYAEGKKVEQSPADIDRIISNNIIAPQQPIAQPDDQPAPEGGPLARFKSDMSNIATGLGNYAQSFAGASQPSTPQVDVAPKVPQPVESPAAQAEAPMVEQPAQPSKPMAKQPMVEPPPKDLQSPVQMSDEDNKPDFVALAKKHADDIRGESEAFAKDLMDGHIAPKTYADLFHYKGGVKGEGNERSTLGKIGMIFAMMAGGMGSGLTGQPNQLIAAMDKLIQNDLEGQRTSKANAQNFFRLSQAHDMNYATIAQMQKQGRLTDAQAKDLLISADAKSFALANMRSRQAALHTMVEAMKRLPEGSPQQMRAQQALAALVPMIQGDNMKLADQAAATQSLMDLQFGNPGEKPNDSEAQFQMQQQWKRRTGAAKLADEEESHHVPGEPLGVRTSTPLIPEYRNKIDTHKNLDSQLDDLYKWIHTHRTILGNPMDPDYNTGVEKVAKLQTLIRNGFLGGVWKESEQPLLKKLLIDNPAGIFKENVAKPQLQELRRGNWSDYNNFRKNTLGLPIQLQPSPSTTTRGRDGKEYEKQVINGKTYYVTVGK